MISLISPSENRVKLLANELSNNSSNDFFFKYYFKLHLAQTLLGINLT